MKTFFLLLAFTCISILSYPQTKGNIQVYGFKQYVSGGKAPDVSIEGPTSPGAKQGKNYFLYAVAPSRIYAVELWLEGVRYGVTVKPVSQTPVAYSDEANIGSPKTILVPKTSQKVFQLTPIAAGASKGSFSKSTSLSAANELIIIYKQKGKFYYTAIKALNQLDGAAMQ